ncbi:MAG: LacI family DNA-binding transcriptional regulator [Capsulimonadaceae bacterium]|nr:LacI family DNA-binding transcriptional regulator [Capsulimonadaceae bacterium]
MITKKPSSSDVADRAGVSLATVSYVFNGRKGASVPDATRTRVLEAAQMIGYRPNRLARGLAHGKSFLIGMVSRLDTFDGRIAAPIRDDLTNRGYQILLTRSRQHWEIDPAEVEILLEHRVDGLVCVSGGWGRTDPRPWVPAVVDHGVPCVIINDADATGKLDCVVSDNIGGALAIIAHLASRGHRRIGHIPGGDSMFTGYERHQGYLKALATTGLAADPDLVQGEGYSIEAGYQGAQRLLSLPDRPTAIFAANDISATGAYHAAMDLGFRVPQDVAIAGFGNEREAQALRLTTIEQHPAAMAAEAAKLLMERIEHPEREAQTRIVPVELMVRGTT